MVAAWSDERRSECVRLYQSGKTIVEVALAMKAGSLVVQKYLRLAGVQMRRRTKREAKDLPQWTAGRVGMLLRLYKSGLSVKDCSLRLRCTQGVVLYWLRRESIPLRRDQWEPEKIERLLEFYRSGKNIAQACKEFDTHKGTVKKYLREFEVPLHPFSEATPHGDRHHAWKGGRLEEPDGYVYLLRKNHPNRNRHGYVAEHRLVMEEFLGRYLTTEEVVHHRDKNKKNNHIDNLELFASNAEHLSHELRGQVPRWTEGGKRRIREGQRNRRKKSRSGAHPSPALPAPTGT